MKDGALILLAAATGIRAQPASAAARDEKAWQAIAQSFIVSRDPLYLNHASIGCLPRPVFEAVQRYTREVELHPFNIFRYNPQLEPIRQDLAKMYGCAAEEVAIVRNSTEALQAVLLGVPLRAGDEILTTTQDYWAMIDALDQRAARDGVVIRKVRVPVPAHTDAELLSAFESGITDRTRLILLSHPVNLTGQHMPVRKISQMAHARGIEVVVDAAQSFGQFPVTAESLGCDYMGTSLHKWLLAPKGTGMLYVRKDKIEKVWPLFASGSRSDVAQDGTVYKGSPKTGDIRKFEQFGTAPMTILGIAEAIRFHNAIGTQAIAERLGYLTRLWTDELRKIDRFEFRTSFAPGMSNAIVTVNLKGTTSRALQLHLENEERIITSNQARRTPEFQGTRVSVGLATTPAEVERFVQVMRRLAREFPHAA